MTEPNKPAWLVEAERAARELLRSAHVEEDERAKAASASLEPQPFLLEFVAEVRAARDRAD